MVRIRRKIIKGKFIVIDGPDGCGKTTQARLLYEHLSSIGKDVVLTRDPGGTRIGERIREILLNPENHGISAGTEAFLYLACRSQLVGEIIKPALEAGKIVISERFQISTEVYQGYAGALPLDKIVEMGKVACENIKPDLTIILDVDAQVGLARCGKNPDRMEQKGRDFHEKIRRGFLELAKRDKNIKVVGGERPIGEIAEEIKELASSVI